MEIILTKTIKGLGYQYDVVTVKPGYARNYLIPQGFAVTATASNRKMMDELVKQQTNKLAKIKEDAQMIANAIGDMTLEMITKAGTTGKIFGAITPLQIAEALKAKGFDIDRKDVSIPQPIKMLGTYKAFVELHKEVKHEITLVVTSDTPIPAPVMEEKAEDKPAEETANQEDTTTTEE